MVRYDTVTLGYDMVQQGKEQRRTFGDHERETTWNHEHLDKRNRVCSGGIYLQGYTVREQPYGSKKSSIELKPPSDEFKTFYFCAENATENKR